MSLRGSPDHLPLSPNLEPACILQFGCFKEPQSTVLYLNRSAADLESSTIIKVYLPEADVRKGHRAGKATNLSASSLKIHMSPFLQTSAKCLPQPGV